MSKKKVLAKASAGDVFDAVVGYPRLRNMSEEEKALVMASKGVHDAEWALGRAKKALTAAEKNVAKWEKALEKANERFEAAQRKVGDE